MIESESKFTLTDRAGESHRYRVTPLVPSQNIDLMLEIGATIAEPGLRVVKIAIEANQLDTDIKELLNSVDWAPLGADIAAALRGLAGRPDIIRRLMAGVIRDEKDLATDAGFNGAFTANPGELIALIRKVVEINGLLDFLG